MTGWSRLWVGLGVVAGLALIVGGAGFVWPKLQDATTAGAVSAMGTVLGAVVGFLAALASAVAAMAAWKAAKQSDETAKRAVEALGLAMEPTLEAYVMFVKLHEGLEPPRDLVVLTVENQSRWPATDVEVRLGDRDETPVARIDYLPPAAQPNPTVTATPSKVEFELDSRAEDDQSFGDLLVVDFSDERGLLRWRKTIERGARINHELVRLR